MRARGCVFCGFGFQSRRMQIGTEKCSHGLRYTHTLRVSKWWQVEIRVAFDFLRLSRWTLFWKLWVRRNWRFCQSGFSTESPANAPHSSDDQSSPLFSDGERAKLVSSFGVSSLGEVDSLVNEVEQFWKDLRIHGGENTADRIRSMELGDATRSTILQIWNELGKTILSQNQAETRPSAVVPGKVSDLLDVDYSVGVIVARKENDDSLPKPVMQMELSTSTGPMNVELDFEQLAALHAALRDAQAHFDSS